MKHKSEFALKIFPAQQHQKNVTDDLPVVLNGQEKSVSVTLELRLSHPLGQLCGVILASEGLVV
ncbi:hypothetical protein GCM10027157_17290 [Corynebacterium aquatimens]|uniref:Uncharacterized protein n=1 Tax=Corynebacterium aquatimens TaxID=1190508 RepID=A0A931GXX9_9CORY|nr:hypothetical protein [Corynebacterium aquatimens]MBG6122759.1 hypothetical protein [Corynebacterium aquatimens]